MNELVENVLELIGREITVVSNSSYVDRLRELLGGLEHGVVALKELERREGLAAVQRVANLLRKEIDSRGRGRERRTEREAAIRNRPLTRKQPGRRRRC